MDQKINAGPKFSGVKRIFADAMPKAKAAFASFAPVAPQSAAYLVA